MFKEGTIISCPKCGAHQLKSTLELKPNSQMRDAAWESLGYDMKNQSMQCHQCWEPWHKKHPISGRTQIHIEGEGWISLSKNI